jgi:hypothetical protein
MVFSVKDIMIKNTIDLLTTSDYYGISKRVDIAKGRHEIPTTLKGFWKLVKRHVHGRKNRS